jgi:hypothetical protein
MERNSRWGNDPRLDKNGKPIRVRLQTLDYEIFAEFASFGMVRATFIHALTGGYYDAVRDRLCLLNSRPNNYLDKPPQFKKQDDPDAEQPNRLHQPLVYFLAGRGWSALERYLGLPIGGSNFRRVALHPGRGRYEEFDHDLMTSDVLISIKASAKERGIRFISWHEVLERSPDTTQKAVQPLRMQLPKTKTQTGKPGHVIPDAMFRLAYPKYGGGELYQSFFVEVDRNTMPSYRSDASISSLERKVLEYRELFDADIPAKQFGFKKPHLLIISNDVGQIERIHARMLENGLTDPRIHLLALPGYGRPDRAPKPALDILDRPFKQAGHPDTYLRYPKLKKEGGDTSWTSTEPASSSVKSKSGASSSLESSAL